VLKVTQKEFRQMNILWNRISLTAHLLVTITGLIFTAPSWADEVYLDGECYEVSEDFKADIRYDVEFEDTIFPKGESFTLAFARVQGGGDSILCLTKSGDEKGERISENVLGDNILREVEKDSERANSFLITLADGNGRDAKLTQYRLNLNNPMRPRTIRVRDLN
jgi:hypothetical protein